MLNLSLERKMIKMINDEERAEIPPLIPGRIAAALVQAMHMVDEGLSLLASEFILKMVLVNGLLLLCCMLLEEDRSLLWYVMVHYQHIFNLT